MMMVKNNNIFGRNFTGLLLPQNCHTFGLSEEISKQGSSQM